MRAAVGAFLLWLMSSGCAATEVAFPSPPVTMPAGWQVIASDAGDIRVALPPWLVPFDTRTSVLANESPRAPAAGFLELMAEGPQTAEPQPASVGQVDEWLASRLNLDAAKAAKIYTAALPAGDALWYAGLDGAGTPSASRYLAYAILTDSGVGFLLIDGPAALWESHKADIDLIPYLLELGFAP